MEMNDDNGFDTDLDEDEQTEFFWKDPRRRSNHHPVLQSNTRREKPFPLSFDDKLAAHRSNRLEELFGQVDESESKIDTETLVPLQYPIRPSTTRVEIYEECCRILDMTSDWQIRGLLPYDTIVLSDRPFSFNDFRALSTAIGINLKNLTLHAVGLTSRSIHVLCQGLSKCRSLNLLDLSKNKIGKRGLECIVAVLNYLPSLLYLSLAECSILDSYGIRIGDLCRHENVIELNLSGNELEENACIFIGNALKGNESLLYLNLSWNLIRSYASIALLRGIEVNRTLTELDLSWSGLSYDGSIALRRVLIVNKVLQRLNLSNCNIEWISAKMISQGLAKNGTLQSLNLSYNPITTHGVQDIIQALYTKKSGLSFLDISGITVFSTSVRLAEKIAVRREFVMKYDCEIPVHDILGRKTVDKSDAMRKVIQHIDERNWRTLEYFRMLDKQNKLKLNEKTITMDILKSGVPLDRDDFETIHRRFRKQSVKPLTYQNLNSMITAQRLRDRSLKVREEQEAKNLQKRNRKILQTVTEHFPDIEILTREEKHRDAIEQLARPRAHSAHPRS